MRDYPHIKFLLWLYFWLLLFEGVLRKWVLPGYSDVIFVIRDPVVMLTYLLAVRDGVFPRRFGVVVLGFIAVFSLIFAMAGDATIVVTVFGMRTNYLHMPLIFVMANVLTRDDVLKFGRWTIFAAVPILILMFAQFDAGPDTWLNAGAGGTLVGGQLRGALGKVRPPGPFSFISGVVSFFTLAMAFVVYGWLNRKKMHWLITLLGTAVVAAAVPVSISRSLLFSLLIVVAFGAATLARDVRRIPAYLGPIIVIVALTMFAAETIYVQAFVTRWEESIEASDAGFYANVVERILEHFTQPFELAAGAPWLGHGIGMGTLAGARLMTGEYTFLLAESELARMVLELGPVLGFAFILWRAWVAGLMTLQGWLDFRATGDSLGWLLAGASFLAILSGQLGPSTTLGFAVFGSGLSLGALNDPTMENDDEEETEDSSAGESESGGEPEAGAAARVE